MAATRAGLGKHLAALGVAASFGFIAMIAAVSVAFVYGLPALLIGGAAAVSTLAVYGWWQTKRVSPPEVLRLRVYGNRVAAVGGAVWGTGWAIASGPWFPIVIPYAVAP